MAALLFVALDIFWDSFTYHINVYYQFRDIFLDVFEICSILKIRMIKL